MLIAVDDAVDARILHPFPHLPFLFTPHPTLFFPRLPPQAGRPVKLIYRAPFGEGPGSDDSPAVARSFIEACGIDPDDLFVQIKFNWSHGCVPSSRVLLGYVCVHPQGLLG